MRDVNENSPDRRSNLDRPTEPDTTTNSGHHSTVDVVSLPTPADTVSGEDRRCSVDGCDRKVYARGWCNRHYKSARRRSEPALPKLTPEQRLMSRVERQPNGCLVWQGHLNAKGYGVIGIDGRTQLVHRVSYELNVGPIDDQLEVHHRCFNRACLNVSHLELVPHSLNVFLREGANPSSKSCWRGVSRAIPSGKWVARVIRHGERHYLGSYDDELTAARAAAEQYAALGEPKPLRDLIAYLQTNCRGEQLGLFSEADA